MNQLKELQKWILAFEKVNNSDPPIKNIKAKIKELLKDEVSLTKIKSSKMYFRDSQWSDYNILRNHLASDEVFVKEFKGVDLRAYIQDALAWSEKGNTSTNLGWKLTLLNWMRKAKREGKLIMKPIEETNKQTGFINH